MARLLVYNKRGSGITGMSWLVPSLTRRKGMVPTYRYSKWLGCFFTPMEVRRWTWSELGRTWLWFLTSLYSCEMSYGPIHTHVGKEYVQFIEDNCKDL
jgi:hypothetical protein